VINDGNVGDNYTIQYITNTNGVIEQRNVTVTAVADTKTYDGTTSSDEAPVVDGIQTGDAVGTAPTQTYDTRNAGTGKTLTASGLVITDGNGGNNYTIQYITNTNGVIEQRNVTVTAVADTKTYDGTTSSDEAPVVDGIQTGDNVGTAPTQTYDTRNAGTGKTLTASGLVINDGNGGGNYTIQYITNTDGVIEQRNVTVTAVADTKTYDGTTSSDEAPVVDGIQTGDAVGTAPTQTYDNRNAGTGKTLTASGLVINDGNGGNNYTIQYITNTNGVIEQRNVTVTAVADTKTYDGTTSSDEAPVVDGIQTGDAVGTAPTQVYDNPFVGTGKTLTASGLVISDGNGGNNYTIQYITNTNGVINELEVIASVVITPNPVQYSDKITVTATITGGAPLISGGPQAAASATFSIVSGSNTQVLESNVTLNASGSNLVATLTMPVQLVDPAILQAILNPGITPKYIRVTFNGVNNNFIVSPNPAQAVLTINKENTVVDYTGQEFASTGSATASTAPVRLSATIRDISEVNPADADAGLITNAKARFVIRTLNSMMSVTSTTYSRWINVTLLGSDQQIGGILLDTVFNIGNNNALQYEIGVEVDSFYTSSTNSIATITVSKTVNDFVTFGGNIRMNPNTSFGLYPSNFDSRLNFGGTAKWNKNGTNLQGGVNVIWRTGNKVYQVKGIVGGSNGSLSVNTSSTSVRRATITAKANVTDTETGLTVPNTNGSVITVFLRDRGEPGTTDSISIEVRNGAGAIVYSSNWSGVRTDERMLSGGNIQIRGSSVTTPAIRTDQSGTRELPVSGEQGFNVKVLGNPTLTHFGLRVSSSDINTKITLRITDVNGRVVEVRENLFNGQLFQFGNNYAQGVYFAEVTQGDERRVIRLVKSN
jgi:hypothetical protein